MNFSEKYNEDKSKFIRETAEGLIDLFNSLQEQKIRKYSEDWSDWDGGTTGIDGACIYVLLNIDQERPQYVGETVNLGKRLSEHFYAQGWTQPQWTHVCYVEDERLKDKRFRLLFEKFCIHILNPTDNQK